MSEGRRHGRRAAASYAIFLAGSAVLVTVLSGAICAGDGEGLTAGGDLPSSRYAEVQAIFDAACTRCHAPGGIGYLQTGGDQNDGLDLTAGAAIAALVDRPTFEAPDVAPMWRVRPGEPESSYLLEKVVSDDPKAGSRMPLDGPPYLSRAEVETIREWIAEGALDE